MNITNVSPLSKDIRGYIWSRVYNNIYVLSHIGTGSKCGTFILVHVKTVISAVPTCNTCAYKVMSGVYTYDHGKTYNVKLDNEHAAPTPPQALPFYSLQNIKKKNRRGLVMRLWKMLTCMYMHTYIMIPYYATMYMYMYTRMTIAKNIAFMHTSTIPSIIKKTNRTSVRDIFTFSC